MKHALLQAVGRWVARHRHAWLVRRAAGLSRHILDWQANLDYELDSNGEALVLRRLAPFEPRVIVDAGANVGDWSLAAHACCAQAQLHAFEISPPTFETLRSRLAGRARVQLHNLGLSDAPGEVTLHHYDQAPALTTVTDYPHPYASQALRARVVRGDDFLEQLGVSHVDLLKIDVEGMEDKVLRGFERLLRERAVDLVQFEYGRVNIISHFLLSDFHALFQSYGYRVGKLYPDGVEWRAYTLADEDFRGPNYLACREDRADLLQALSCARGA
ncbi:FkbM family methyltransferase [Comamonadaceae bacterium G21597-S1]|nr:FkbM family methyltransferase [Comamonadaceae bacterium G21597-S1]